MNRQDLLAQNARRGLLAQAHTCRSQVAHLPPDHQLRLNFEHLAISLEDQANGLLDHWLARSQPERIQRIFDDLAAGLTPVDDRQRFEKSKARRYRPK